MDNNYPIGVFDSGVGGLTVASEIIRRLPYESIVYFGDTARVPYGEKTPQQINAFVREIIDFLSKFKVKAVVMACNTSSALAYHSVKEIYPIPLFEMINPAAEEAQRTTKNNRIGVIANSATVNSNVYKEKLLALNGNYRVFQEACPLLVPLVERGETDTEYASTVLRTYLDRLTAEGIDTLILGCTHYPHLLKPIKKIVGDEVSVLDPAKKVVEKLKEYLSKNNLLKQETRFLHKYFVSGDPEQFKTAAKALFPSENYDNTEKIQLTKIVGADRSVRPS